MGYEPVWPWVFRFDQPKLAAYRAVCATRLGQTADQDRVRRGRHGTGNLTEAARSPAGRAGPYAVVRRAGGSLVCPGGRPFDTGYAMGSERTHHAVRTLRAAIGQRAGAVTAELDERLAAA